MTQETLEIKKQSAMDSLLEQLDGEISRYYNTLNQIRCSRLTIQESNNVCGTEMNTPKEQLGDGLLKKFWFKKTGLNIHTSIIQTTVLS